MIDIARQKNIKIQLHNRIDDMLRIGESKHMAKQAYRNACEANNLKWNPSKAEGIYSTQTAESYRQTVNEFCGWLKENKPEVWNSKSLDKVTSEVAYDYLKHRESKGLSAYTVSKDMAALNKSLNLTLSKKEGNLENRSYKNVTRSRGQCEHDKKYNAANYGKQIEVSKAFGLRRESISSGKYAVQESSFYKKDGKVYCSVIEKGGRFRNAPCLDRYAASISSQYKVPERTSHPTKASFIQNYASGEKLFDNYTKKIDNHAFRGEYARELYKQICEDKGLDTQCIQGKYENDVLKEVSEALGHNRISVVVEHYMK